MSKKPTATAKPGPSIHPSWVRYGGLPLQIMQGLHDEHLPVIEQACRARAKDMTTGAFRKGQKVRAKGTGDARLDGQPAVVLKVNAKTVTIGVGEKDEFGYESEWRVSPKLLEAL